MAEEKSSGEVLQEEDQNLSSSNEEQKQSGAKEGEKQSGTYASSGEKDGSVIEGHEETTENENVSTAKPADDNAPEIGNTAEVETPPDAGAEVIKGDAIELASLTAKEAQGIYGDMMLPGIDLEGMVWQF